MRKKYSSSKKIIIVLFISLFLTQCLYKDYTFKESLSRNFYLMESDILPSKYINIQHEDSDLVLIYDLIEVIGNDDIILVKNINKKGKIQYNLIETAVVEYPEDIKIISYEDFLKRKKKINYEYSYDQNNGFSRNFSWHK
ncbi:hypothetical protein ASD98_01580 [Flavobacterium sp. Root186]|nr:hypothetical protein ASD98_01580 [Flavobacterium sp. Root186]